jgi:transposase
LVHDKFHVIKYLTDGIDQTRRQEVKKEPLLKKARYAVLKRLDTMTKKQREKFESINAANLVTSKAWKMRENFLELYECKTKEDATAFFDRWYENVIHSNIAPMKKAARTLKNHIEGITNRIGRTISNGKAEQNNNKIARLQRAAYGYRNVDNLRKGILFFNGQLDLHIKISPA